MPRQRPLPFRLRRACLIVLALAAGSAVSKASPAPPPVTRFSTAPVAAAMPAPWSALTVPNVARNTFALIAGPEGTVLEVRSMASAGTLLHPLKADTVAWPRLSWRWKVERMLTRANLNTRAGDDFAARVYVFFDLPAERLPFTERAKLALARALHGDQLPAAALCYVWDNTHPAGTSVWNPYTDRVRTIVLRTGGTDVGTWIEESVDLAADFTRHFGLPVAPVSGIAIGADTDQTGESVRAWFGDFTLQGSRR